jgi:FKBP-type peptidyl-prolyl cis-trans isomerase SlyD
MTIKKNALVSLSLMLSDENGNAIEENDEDIIYLHGGYGQIFKKLKDELEGKNIGDKFSVALSASEAFGEFREDLVLRDLLSDMPQDVEVGMELEGLVDGVLEGVVFQVVEMDDTYALLDGNHPYAGVPMIATGEVLEIEYLSDEAIEKILQHEEH